MTIRVLIVDDSAVMRAVLTAALKAAPDIAVVGQARDADDARAKIKALEPDVVTLDVEMPGMDGLTFLERLMRLRPTPVVMCSTLTHRGAEAAIKALALGAVDVVGKPVEPGDGMDALGLELAAKIRVAAQARVRPLAARAPVAKAAGVPGARNAVIAIASSTGGPEALEAVLTRMPTDGPAILVTQHMPAAFMTRFAERLSRTCGLPVAVAEHGQRIEPGAALLAPGDRHLLVDGRPGRLTVKLDDGPPRSGHRPAADVMFESLAECAPRVTTCVVLSGMGRDGAAGAKLVVDRGGAALAQDRATSVVFGMPKAAYEIGAAPRLTPLPQIADEALKTINALAAA